jgi:DNA repair protein RecO (recombination protein O)
LHLTSAIVLRSRPFGESDRIVCFLTEQHGKVTGIAKGAKRSQRRFVNCFEPFSLVHLRFQDYPNRTLAFVHACELLRVFKHLTRDLELIATASYLTEIVAELVHEREENQQVFQHLRDGLSYLDEHIEHTVANGYLIFFALKLLRLSGYAPVFESCCRCRKVWSSGGGKWFFCYRDGGVLCSACSNLRRDIVALSEETLRAFATFRAQDRFTLDSSRIHPITLRESRFLLSRFIEFQINKPLKSTRFLDSFCTT